MELSARIASIRKQMGLSQEKFGDLVNMSQRSVAAWESGERTPSYPVLVDLADKLGLSVDYLMGRSDLPKTVKSPTAEGDEARMDIINRIQHLQEPALPYLSAFLKGLEAGQEIASPSPAAPDPSSGSAG